MVNLLVEILAPFKGTIYDPACGAGGMFVQSAKFKGAHQKTLGKKGDLTIHSQELMASTRRLCLMNLAVHGLDGNIGQSYGSSFTNDQHKTLRADCILANGAKMPRSSWKDIANYPLCVPPDSAVQAFNETVEPMLRRIKANVEAASTLAKLRDTLLPRLISGKLRLPEVTKPAEAVLA